MSRPSLWEWVQTALLAANLVWTTLCLGGYLPSTLVVTGALTTAMLVVHLLERAQLATFSRGSNREIAAGATSGRFHPAGWLLLPFLAYAAVNVLWITPVSWLGWQDWFLWAQMTAVFWVVVNDIREPTPRMVLFTTLLALAVINVLLGSYQRVVHPGWMMLGGTQPDQFWGRASGSFGIPNSLGAFLLLLIPPCVGVALRRRTSQPVRVFFVWLAGLLLFGLILTISRGALIAIGLALSLWPLFSRRWRLRRRLAVACGVVVIGASAMATLYWQAPKVRERLAILVRDTGELSRPIMWRAAWKIFLANPAWGSGAGSFRVKFEKHRPEHHQNEADWAHNEYLNTLSDYGAVGLGLLLGGVGAVACGVARQPRETSQSNAGSTRRPAPTGSRVKMPRLIEHPYLPTAFAIGLLAFGFQLFVDFHFKIPALGLACATIAGIVVGRRWPVVAESQARTAGSLIKRVLCAGAAVVVAWVGVAWNTPRLRAEGIRFSLRADLDALVRRNATPDEKIDVAQRALDGLAAVVTLDPDNAQAWGDRAYAAAVVGREQPGRATELGREAEHDARRALALSQAAPEFWFRLGVALDMQGRWNEAGPAVSEGLRLAPISAPAWFYQAYHFALNPVTQPLAKSAVATCLRLDPSNREADALRRHLDAGR